MTRGELHVKIDVKDKEKEIVVLAEIPGVELEDVDIALTSHYLSISGTKHAEKDDHHKGYYHLERSYGFFRRVIPLPCEVEKEGAEAIFKNGLLRIKLPKTQAAINDERKIAIKTG
jgi:HSP20 family protein